MLINLVEAQNNYSQIRMKPNLGMTECDATGKNRTQGSIG
jgi:hypothetical protein